MGWYVNEPIVLSLAVIQLMISVNVRPNWLLFFNKTIHV